MIFGCEVSVIPKHDPPGPVVDEELQILALVQVKSEASYSANIPAAMKPKPNSTKATPERRRLFEEG